MLSTISVGTAMIKTVAVVTAALKRLQYTASSLQCATPRAHDNQHMDAYRVSVFVMMLLL
jgi:hypothetical protein